ncbi:MAG: hypothetical protein H6807_13575 [Planctomycetes bacterium]|nr:hypothetical protein [Planctomycetota bacterium]
MIRLLPLMALLALLATACTTSHEGDAAAKDPQGTERVMVLYRIDIDPKAVAAGAPLLFDEPPPQNSFGLVRRGQGYFSASDAGFCRIEVKVAEPVVAVDGRHGEQVYMLLKFFGRASDDGSRATIMSGESVNVSSGSQADEVRFFERGRNKISAQAYQGGKPSAYIFHFQHAAIARRDVPVPWR